MNELSAEYARAVELNRRIMTSAQLAQQSLYDMCMGFKEMRDSKLYKELGYQSFEEYCEQETGFAKSNVYNYISIVEKLPEEFVHSSGRIGVKKLTLLAKLSDDERSEITENTDLENTSVKQLESEIKKLREEAELDHKEREKACDAATRYRELAERRNGELRDYEKKVVSLQQQIKELESRPIEVAVAEPSDSERRLQETIRSLERENIRQNEALEESYRKQTDELRRMLEEEKRRELDTLAADREAKLAELRSELERIREEYECKLAEKPQTAPAADPDKEKFKIYLVAAHDAVTRLIDFARQTGKAEYTDKIRQLLKAMEGGI